MTPKHLSRPTLSVGLSGLQPILLVTGQRLLNGVQGAASGRGWVVRHCLTSKQRLCSSLACQVFKREGPGSDVSLEEGVEPWYQIGGLDSMQYIQ